VDVTPLQAGIDLSRKAPATLRKPLFEGVRNGTIERGALTLAIAAIPISIAVTESLLALALAVRLFRCLRGEVRAGVPRVFWLWLALAAAEIVAWLFSPLLRDGWGEIRHLLLVGSLFLVLPVFDNAFARANAWRALFLSSALGSLFLIGDFVSRLFDYHPEIQAGEDVSFYLRTGGLLNNWMVYGTVEILVVAGLLSFWFAYPEQRRRWWPVVGLNAVAVVLSLTRTVWVSTLLLMAIQLWWKRSRWLLVLPILPVAFYFLAPGVVRSRLNVSMHADYFSNAERIQMLKVGWRMVREHPWFGVGPGRVEKLYRSTLNPSDPVPAYHGHLHNNLVQLAAQFGIPVALVAILFALFLFQDLMRASGKAENHDEEFLCRAGLLALTGFLTAGLFDYTYGHSLALILVMFSVLSPLIPTAPKSKPSADVSATSQIAHLV
jgi:putative inorganic carbon (hco3(-)) transporter